MLGPAHRVTVSDAVSATISAPIAAPALFADKAIVLNLSPASALFCAT